MVPSLAMQVDAVIVAGGSSSRFGGGNKLVAALAGRPLLAWSLAAFEEAASVLGIILVASADSMDELRPIAESAAPTKLLACVCGGERRRDSVEAGLRASSSRYVAIHDGARPLITTALINDVVDRAQTRPGAILAVPVTDTIKEVRGGKIIGHPHRDMFWAAQTPQVVLRQAWLDAAASGDGDETDDAAMLARLGLDCFVLEGDPENIKVTHPADLAIAEAVLRRGGEG